MAAKKTVAKKTVAKKTTAAKKTPAKKTTAAKRTAHVSGSRVGDPAEGFVAPVSTGDRRVAPARYTTKGRQTVQRVNEAQTMSVEEVAAHALKGKMGTGRDRDDALRQAGHDPAEVTKMMNKLTKEAAPPKQTLPIPNNRRGSSWT